MRPLGQLHLVQPQQQQEDLLQQAAPSPEFDRSQVVKKQEVPSDQICVNKITFAVGSAAVIFMGLGLFFASLSLLRNSR